MNRFQGHIERRLFNAVVLVLGACGPTQPDPQRVTEPTPGDAAIAVVPVGDAPVSVESVDTAVVASGGDAKGLCAGHKQRSPVVRSKVRQGKPPWEGHQVQESAHWDAQKGIAVCTIVHERVRGNVTVMHQPHWCPQGGGKPPGPSPRELPGEKILVERVSLRADGTVVKSDAEWTASASVNEPRHNCGRRFEGLVLEEIVGSDVGAQLAAMAELEAASVPAFDRLARELAMWGAPEDLVQRAQLATCDEIRHARVMTKLAREYGHTPRAIDVPPLPCRSLEAIAHENAIEGCVREAYGALVATYQAERARADLRPVFRAIADDERRHAQLAEDVHAWILGRLEADARETIEHARERAEAELRAGVTASRACSTLGLPSAHDAVALCDAYFA